MGVGGFGVVYGCVRASPRCKKALYIGNNEKRQWMVGNKGICYIGDYRCSIRIIFPSSLLTTSKSRGVGKPGKEELPSVCLRWYRDAGMKPSAQSFALQLQNRVARQGLNSISLLGMMPSPFCFSTSAIQARGGEYFRSGFNHGRGLAA